MKYLIFSIIILISFSSYQIKVTPEQEVHQKVLELQDALINPTAEKIDALVHEKLTYGHSSGLMEDKAAFKNALLTGEDVTTWKMSKEQIEIIGSTAWVRHYVEAQIVSKGEIRTLNLNVLLIWTKNKKEWRLLARQAVK